VQTPFELIENSHVPVEKIYISLQNRGLIKESFASAVVIDDCLAVTNRHVLDRTTQMTGIMARGEAFVVESSVVSERLDLALFRIPCGIGQAITTGQRVKEGDTIYSVGTARGDPYLTGEVQYPLFELYHQKLVLKHPIGGKDDGHSVTLGFLYTGKFKKGFSGGPVVNASGELVGINQGYLRRFLSTASAADIRPRATYGLAYHIEDVLEEVEQLRKHLRR
jgi:S1-C subfamily serine protease